MMKKIVMTMALAMNLFSGAYAWELWDDFRAVSMEDGRVVDYSDKRVVTTSEGQSYAMFFALVAGDKQTFEELLNWTEDNLAGGDIGKNYPAWLWGKEGDTWMVIDDNNAVDSDMWIAYCLLEAGRLWDTPEYIEKAHQMLGLLRTQVRDIENLGKVLLPGRFGFETDTEVKLNPSYYPLFLIKRFAAEDAYWNDVYEGSARMLIRSAPAGIVPDWVNFTKKGELVQNMSIDNTIGSYNAIRVYLWAAMLSPKDPVYRQLKARFEPMVRLTQALNMPPEKVDVYTLAVNQPAWDGFGACLMELVGPGKTRDMIRTVLKSTPIKKENYYRNVLALYGLGFDEKLFAFDENGFLYFPNVTAK
ncbi:MAG: cellulose synthase complex periplasmic endoglucanase BcsZ [Candidatus Aphodousia sp.]|nr:cellulose synthase complex periplasmic endoglucanase BcsZ [Sutterella sp.]MDY2899580.1 cellulose synthase complex periplasmic endoglucanase BcsZ [Candidatus Aphodousia sp.]